MRALLAIACSACIQPPPHATLVVNGDRQPTSHAVLVMPTTCASADPILCDPKVYYDDSANLVHRVSPTFASYIDPALRLKLEFAGFTLAEAGAMRLTTADRVDVNGQSQRVEDTVGPHTVADLPLADARGIASSLALTSVLVSTLTIVRVEHGMVRGDLVVALLDVTTNLPRWTVTCRELLLDPIDTPNRLANCAGNGVLAVLAPDNVIGRAL